MKQRFMLMFVATSLLVPCVLTFLSTSSTASTSSSTTPHQHVHARQPTQPQQVPTSGTPVCGQPVLQSPYSYNGGATTFTSGQFGLPTFGSAGTNYPNVTASLIIPAGNNSGVNVGTLNADNTIVYFEPGDHTGLGQIQPGQNAVFIGGYVSGPGEAAIDNGHNGGTTFISGASHVTIRYLTIDNFDGTVALNSFGGSVVDQDGGDGWDVSYDTVGPNGYTLGHPYTGYGIGIGSDSTYEFDCVINNGEGGFNNGTQTDILPNPSPWSGPQNFTVSFNEMNANAIATDTSTTVWGDMCGCAAALKIFWANNGTIDYNYIHDNYGSGLWPDTNNSGIDMSHNYIIDNFDVGIFYEASFNANITDNAIIENGWNPKGTSEWAGYPNGYQPTNGGGPGFADRSIYISNSGGSTGVLSGSTRYAGQMNITGNYLNNNFGGIVGFADRNRFCGEGADGGQGTCTINGNYSGGSIVGSPYYVQSTSYADDATLSSGSQSLTTTGGFLINYNSGTSQPANGWTVAAYNSSTGDPVPGIIPSGDTISSCSSNNSCTLTVAATANVTAGSESGTPIEIEAGAPGGCGMYDLNGSSPGAITGSPPEKYFDNCNWFVQDMNVSGNTFRTVANPTLTYIPGEVTNCTPATGCGYMTYYAQLGPAVNGAYWSPYAGAASTNYIASATANNKWGSNSYSWIGPGQWTFEAGQAGITLTQSQWQAGPYNQDTSSTFNARPPGCFGLPQSRHPGKRLRNGLCKGGSGAQRP
jgi:Right handed beta helix region